MSRLSMWVTLEVQNFWGHVQEQRSWQANCLKFLFVCLFVFFSKIVPMKLLNVILKKKSSARVSSCGGTWNELLSSSSLFVHTLYIKVLKIWLKIKLFQLGPSTPSLYIYRYRTIPASIFFYSRAVVVVQLLRPHLLANPAITLKSEMKTEISTSAHRGEKKLNMGNV